MKMRAPLHLVSYLVASLLLTACSTSAATSDASSASPSSSAKPAKSVAASSAAPPAKSVAPPPTAVARIAPKRKRPAGWKDEWQPFPEEGDSVFDPPGHELTRKDVPDPATCPIDGPFWGEGVSYWGSPCTESELSGCAEIAQHLYEHGRWECAKVYHALLCKLAPDMTAPPPGGGDYPMAGYPLCPPEKDPRFAKAEKQLADPTTKSCYVGHSAKACIELAAKEQDPVRRQRLGQLAAAWE